MKKKNKAADKKKNLRLALAAIVLAFILVITISIYLRPGNSPKAKDEPITEVSSSVAKNLTNNDDLFFSTRKRTKKENLKRRKVFKNLSSQMKNMSPDTKRSLSRKIIKLQIARLRKKTSKMNEEQKLKYINALRDTIRNDFKTMSKKDTSGVKKKMRSEKGKKEVNDALGTYYNEISANDRKLYDPLVMDMIGGLNAVVNSKK